MPCQICWRQVYAISAWTMSLMRHNLSAIFEIINFRIGEAYGIEFIPVIVKQVTLCLPQYFLKKWSMLKPGSVCSHSTYSMVTIDKHIFVNSPES
jgi:hypothetical protein